MTTFETADMLGEWDGLRPVDNEPAGERKSGETAPGDRRIRRAFREGAPLLPRV
jgi:hypothetical protein